MSYSFNVRAATKGEAKAKVSAELDKVVLTQPAHAADRDAAQALADSFIDLVLDDPTQDIYVQAHGSVYATEEGLRNAGAGVSVSLAQKNPS